MTIPTPGDRVVARWALLGGRHGEVETVRPAMLLIEPTEVTVRWNDNSCKVYSASRFEHEGNGTWSLKR
jgi:hypothetical protein